MLLYIKANHTRAFDKTARGSHLSLQKNFAYFEFCFCPSLTAENLRASFNAPIKIFEFLASRLLSQKLCTSLNGLLCDAE